MSDVQVFEGQGPHPRTPVNEAGEKHGIWTVSAIRHSQGPRTDAGWTTIEKKQVAKITFDNGKQVGPVEVFTESDPEPKLYKFIYGYNSEKPDNGFFFGPPWNSSLVKEGKLIT